MKVVHPGLAWETVGWPPSATQAGAPNEHPQECAVDAARSTPVGRAHYGGGLECRQAAQAAGISVRQSYRWLTDQTSRCRPIQHTLCSYASPFSGIRHSRTRVSVTKGARI